MEVTRDEFIRRTGMTPEEFEAQHPELVDAVKTTKKSDRIKQRRYVKKEGEKVDTYDTGGKLPVPLPPGMNADIADVLKAVEDTTGLNIPVTTDPRMQQMERNARSGVMQIPTDFAGLYGLVKVGTPALIKGLSDDDPNKSRMTAVGEAFTSALFDEEDQKKLTDHLQGKAKEFATANPEATPDDINQFIEEYHGSDEFFDFANELLPEGLSLANAANKIANKIAGMDKLPSEQTALDELYQIGGQSIIGIPKATMRGLQKALTAKLGANVMDNPAMKAAIKAAEVTTPVTLPLTPGNAALNAGVGTGINEAMRWAQDAPMLTDMFTAREPYLPPDTLIPEEPPYNPEMTPATWLFGVTTGVTAAAMFGIPGVRRVLRESFDKAKEDAVKAIQPRTLEEQSDKLEPILGPHVGLADQNAPVREVVKRSAPDVETGRAVADDVDVAMSSASSANRVESVNNALNYGILENVDNTIPYADIERSIAELPKEEQMALRDYLFAITRQQEDTFLSEQYTKQLRDAQVEFDAARRTGNVNAIRQATAKVEQAKTRYNEWRQDTRESRPVFTEWSREDVEARIKLGETNPNFTQIADAFKRTSNDLLKYKYKNNLISEEEMLEQLATYPLHFKLQEREYPKLRNRYARRAMLFKDRVTNVENSNRPFRVTTGSRNLLDPDAPKIDAYYAKDPWIGLKESIIDTVSSVTVNKARLDIIDALRKLPGTEGKRLRKVEGKVDPDRRPDLISTLRAGKREYWEFGDKAVTKALQFAPIASVPLFNATRKLWQTFTTGVGAPWFAVKTFFWDVPLAKVTMPKGRSLGLIDTYARRLLGESALINAAADHLPDPTAFISAAGAVPYALGLRASRAAGLKIAQDLKNNSGVFSLLAKSLPMGDRLIQWTGESMVRAFDKSAYAVMTQNLSTSLSHFGDTAKIIDDYSAGVVRNKGALKTTWNAYKAAVESVQMATKTAFFAENYGRLQAKYKGNIPKRELKLLVQDTRNLTADMSRVSANKYVQQATSVIPYGNPVIQGTRHILTAALSPRRASKFWTQFYAGMLMPKLGALAVLSEWEGAEDWWYNKVPVWQQQSVIPFPNAAAIEHRIKTGSWPQFSPEYMNMLPTSPEFALITEPVIAGLQAMGIVGPARYSVPTSLGDRLHESFKNITSFATPPLLQLGAALVDKRFDASELVHGQNPFRDLKEQTFGGANADTMTVGSEIDDTLYHIIGALASATGQLAIQTLNVFDMAQEETDDFWQAADKALDSAAFTFKTKLPNIDVPQLYDAPTRDYAFSKESEYVFETERALDPVFRQTTIERDAKDRRTAMIREGLMPANQIQDPNLKSIAGFIWNTLKRKGTYKTTKEQYTEVKARLEALERTRVKMTEKAYNDTRNEYVRKQQQLVHIQSQVLQQMENEITNQLGDDFKQMYGVPFTFENFSKLVRKDVGGKFRP